MHCVVGVVFDFGCLGICSNSFADCVLDCVAFGLSVFDVFRVLLVC